MRAAGSTCASTATAASATTMSRASVDSTDGAKLRASASNATDGRGGDGGDDGEPGAIGLAGDPGREPPEDGEGEQQRRLERARRLHDRARHPLPARFAEQRCDHRGAVERRQDPQRGAEIAQVGQGRWIAAMPYNRPHTRTVCNHHACCPTAGPVATNGGMAGMMRRPLARATLRGQSRPFSTALAAKQDAGRHARSHAPARPLRAARRRLVRTLHRGGRRSRQALHRLGRLRPAPRAGGHRRIARPCADARRAGDHRRGRPRRHRARPRRHRRGYRGGPLRVVARPRGRALQRRAAPHRGGGRRRQAAAHRALAQRPGGHRRAPVAARRDRRASWRGWRRCGTPSATWPSATLRPSCRASPTCRWRSRSRSATT